MSGARWTPEQDAVLVARYATERAEDIARDLGMTTARVFNRAHKLGLRKSADFLRSVDYIRATGGGDAHHRTDFIAPAIAAPVPPKLAAASELTREIELVLSPIEAGFTAEALRERLIERLQKPLPDLHAAIDSLVASGHVRETRTGPRVSYRWIGQARAT